MRCLACNVILTDREASRKYVNHANIPNSKDKYIDLCDHCLVDTDLNYIENTQANDTPYDDESETNGNHSEI